MGMKRKCLARWGKLHLENHNELGYCMKTNGQQDVSGQESAPASERQVEKINESRRRFGKSGVAASGVLLTLASRPVLGAEVCKSPSGFLSGNLSTHGGPAICEGRSPGYWKNQTSWPIANRFTCKFSSVFTCRPRSPYAPITMLNLLSPQDFDSSNLGMHLVAAYLNAMEGWTPFLTVERIQSMFSEWQATGYFSPTAGVNWSAAEIVDYLKRTQD
jgi:hypothetical protein